MKSLVDVADEIGDFAEIGIFFRLNRRGKVEIHYNGMSEAAYYAARDFRNENVTALQLMGHMKWVTPELLREIDFMKHRVTRGDFGVDPGKRVIRPTARKKS